MYVNPNLVAELGKVWTPNRTFNVLGENYEEYEQEDSSEENNSA